MKTIYRRLFPLILSLLLPSHLLSADEHTIWDTIVSQKFGDGNIPVHWNWKPSFGSDENSNQHTQIIELNPKDTNGININTVPVIKLKPVYELEDTQDADITERDASEDSWSTSLLGQALNSLISNPTPTNTAIIIDSPHIPFDDVSEDESEFESEDESEFESEDESEDESETIDPHTIFTTLAPSTPAVLPTEPPTAKTTKSPAKTVVLETAWYKRLPGSNLIIANDNPPIQVLIGSDVPVIQLPGSHILIADPNTGGDTTTMSTPASTTASSVISCNNCIYTNSVGYIQHATDCTKFLKCVKLADGSFIAYEHQCPFGLYWNSPILSCDYRRNTNCTTHPCKSTPLKYAAMSGRCSGYWRCDMTEPFANCCPAGRRFNAVKQDCDIDSTCTDVCENLTPPPVTVHCDKRSLSETKGAFEQRVPGNKWVRIDCPITTAFNQNTCGCTDIIKLVAPTYKVCEPQLHLSFTKKVSDDSKNKYYIHNKGVTTNWGFGYFGDNSKLLVDRFANAPFGNDLTLELTYEPTDRNREQVLISNGDCGVKPSLHITTGPNGVTFRVKTSRPHRTSIVTVPITKTSGPIKAKMILYNNRLTGKVEGIYKSAYAAGSVRVTKSSLIIGSDTGKNKFIGVIDDVKIFFCQHNG